MVNKKITDLTDLPTPVAADVIAIVDDVGGAGVATKKATLSNALAAYDNQTATLENKSIDQDGTGNDITNIANASIKTGAGILQSKLALDITNSEVNAGAAILYSKLDLSASIKNADIASAVFSSITGIGALTNNLQESKGADLASATTITLGTDGNYFDITGTTTIGYINSTGYQAGSRVTLQFDGILTVTHAKAGATGAQVNITLDAAADKTTAAGNTLTLTYDGTTWRETGGAGGGGGGGGMDPEIDAAVQVVGYTPTAATQNATGYMFTRKIDANNDGLYITLWKNGSSQVVQIA
tara:strand:+ start:2434 stop:3330 length:897 start_codon:yes stop_codon:yes gene_type:complete